jgi:deoxyribose-phosphate aldolase
MNLAQYIDHTVLTPDCSDTQILQCCEEAIKYKFHSVCVPPYFVSHARKLLFGTKILVCTVAGFPIGYESIHAKEKSVNNSIDSGADEIDVLINVSAVKSGDWEYVKDEIREMTGLGNREGKIVKFTLEAGKLKTMELEQICNLCNEESVDFVKTSTGLFGSGATIEMVQELRRMLKQEIKIMASGGINDTATTIRLIKAGADRIGTSNGVDILNGQIIR